MFGNITYLPKKAQPKKIYCGETTTVDNIFGYQGAIIFGFIDGMICALYLTNNIQTLQNKYPDTILDNAPNTLQERAKIWLETGENPLDLVLYGTDFQHKVWKELINIQTGTTATYQQVAKKINAPKAVRAVGSSVGKNPVSLIVPCHRVINKNGNKVSYAWGADTKLQLLAFEAQINL